MFISKTKFNELINRITIINNNQEIMWNKTHKWANEVEAKLYALEEIIKNQQLIKKYQKTLDIFLKNAKN